MMWAKLDLDGGWGVPDRWYPDIHGKDRNVSQGFDRILDAVISYGYV